MNANHLPLEALNTVIERLDPLAREGIKAAGEFNVAGQRHVFNQLHARFGTASPRTERQTLAISCYLRALESCDIEEMGEDGYSAWYRTQPTAVKETLLAGPTVRRIMGGWKEVRAAVKAVPLVRFSSVQRRAVGKSFRIPELIEILQRFAEDHDGDIHFSDYAPWAEAECAAGRRVPRNFQTFYRRFPSKQAMYEAAGLDPKTIPRHAHYSDETIIEVVVEANSAVEGDLTERKFERWRRLRNFEGRRIPSRSTINDRFGDGNWNRARDRCLANTSGGDA